MPSANRSGRLLAAMLMLVAAGLSASQAWGLSPNNPLDDEDQTSAPPDDLLANCPPPVNPAATPPRCPWYLLTQGVLLQRDAGHTTNFAAINTASDIELATNLLDFPLKAGGQVLIGRTINRWNQVEFSYMGVEHWSDSVFIRDETANSQGGFGNIFSPFTNFGNPAVVGLDFNNFVSIAHKSTFQTAELNWRRYLDMPPGRLTFSTLVGVRYMEIRERFDYESVSEVAGPGGATQNSLTTNTGNYLLGVQLGARGEFYVEGPWWVNFEIKGAICQDKAAQSTEFLQRDVNGNNVNGSPFLNDREHRATSFIGDLALTVLYRFSPHANARFGYQAVFVDNVALADVNALQDINLSATSPLGPGRLFQSSNMVYHGPFAGLELAW